MDFDFSQESSGKVTMHLGLKGIVYMDITCRGGKKGGPTESAMHGSVSAWVSSPVWRLIQALATLTDENERILIDGFYSNVMEPGTEDLGLLNKLEKTFDEKAFLKEMRSSRFRSELRGVELLKRGLYNPFININGIHAGYSGPGTKTVLPRKATAKIDTRFGPRMEPEEVISKIKAHLVRHGYEDIEVRVRDSYTWSKTEYPEPVVQHMVESYRLLGHEPEIWPMATWAAPYFVYSKLLGMPVASGGLGHGGHQHAANEYMTVRGLLDFEKFVAAFLYRTAAGG